MSHTGMPEMGPFRDQSHFLTEVLVRLADRLSDLGGEDLAQSLVILVGTDAAAELRARSLAAAGDPTAVAALLIDLKDRIGGRFHVVEATSERITLRGVQCPFGDAVRGRSSMCLMTLSVFGQIAADALGYARVAVPQSIAQGHAGCLVIIELNPATTGSDRGAGEVPPNTFYRR